MSHVQLSQKDLQYLSDPSWRLDNFYYITNKDKQKVLFKKNQIQQHIHDKCTRFNATLKARQVGISTYWLLKYLDIAAFNENQTVAILSHDRESLRKLFKIIRFAHKNMPDIVRPAVDKGGGSMYRLYFPEINSEIYCTLEAVSDAVSHLHISEMALNENPDSIRTSMDSVPIATGSISIETTPRGYNHFYKFWSNDNSYTKFFFPWYMHHEYKMDTDPLVYTADELKLIEKANKLFGINLTKEQIAFRRFKISQKADMKSFLQEYPEDDASCFITSGDAAMDILKIKELINVTKEPIKQTSTLKIWSEWQKGKVYVAGCDTAEGVNKDYSVCVIINATDREIVAQLKSNSWKPREFAIEVDKLCRLYQKQRAGYPLLAVELNNHGHAVLLELDEHLHYPNLYRFKKDSFGWKTDSVTRPLMIDGFIDAIENQTVIMHSKDVLNECLTLIDNNGKIEAQDGENDDCVIASSIAIQMLKEVNANIIDYTKEFRMI